MKDATNYILTELSTLLTGNVSYSGQTVKFYALNQDPADDETLFVNVSSSYTNNTEGNKDSFIRPYTVNMDIVQRSRVLSEKAVNDISSQIGALIKPTPSSLGIAATNEFATIRASISARSMPELKSGDLWHIRKIMELNFTITQK